MKLDLQAGKKKLNKDPKDLLNNDLDGVKSPKK